MELCGAEQPQNSWEAVLGSKGAVWELLSDTELGVLFALNIYHPASRKLWAGLTCFHAKFIGEDEACKERSRCLSPVAEGEMFDWEGRVLCHVWGVCHTRN